MDSTILAYILIKKSNFVLFTDKYINLQVPVRIVLYSIFQYECSIFRSLE